ncbi:MAG TPA: FkbM family methyltransferase [Pyrinomonadaceae bacterium]|nr:FkbM family methyltransferase [Pyrinomonadaceae bacterium]
MTTRRDTNDESLDNQMPPGLVSKFLKIIHRNNLKGRTLLTLLLARRMKSLQHVAVEIAGWPPIHMDLRYVNAHSWFVGTPFATSPHEVDEQAVMRRFVRPGTVVFDIGANLGLHTLLLAELVGSAGLVVAFEPNTELFPMLERTMRPLSNVKLFPFALSDKEVESTLFVPDDHSMASLADWTTSQPGRLSRLFGLGKTRSLTCRQRRMDDLLKVEGISPPDFIKCDVEGAELMVFRGAHDVLNRRDAPVLLFEAGVESTRGFNLKLTEAADYLAALREPAYQFLEVLREGALRPVQTENFKPQNQNIVAVPKSKQHLT